MINLTDQITYSVYVYTAQGLFERDKLIFLAQVAFQVIPTNVWDIHVAFRQLVLWCCYGCSEPLTPHTGAVGTGWL